MNFGKTADRTIEYSFYLLFVLIPLVMTPWNFELFEYNKMMLVYALTAVIAGAWTVKMIFAKKLIFKRTPFDIPLVIFLISQFLSFLFSIDHHTSFWGYYSRFHGGLLSTVSYLLLYWAFVSNFDKQKTLSAIRYTLATAALVASYGILEHFGIDAKYWVQDVKNRVFSTLGQPNWLAAYLAALLPLPLAFALGKIRNWKLEIGNFFSIYSFTLLLFVACLFFTKSRSGIPAALMGLAFFCLLLALPKIISLKKAHLLLVAALAVFIFAGSFLGLLKKFPTAAGDIRYIFSLNQQANITPQKPFEAGSTSGDIRKVVWRGAFNIFLAYPLFGSGVETFAYSYYQFRPAQHNLLSEWDFLYNKAHNEYFNLLATTGAVGLGSYLLLIGWVIIWNLKAISNRQYEIRNKQNTAPISYLLSLIALFSGWASILITNFFGFSVVPVAIFFFLFPAFAVVLSREEASPQPVRQQRVDNRGQTQYLVLALVLFTIFYLLFTIIQYWRADVAFAQGNKLNKQGEYLAAFNSLEKAISLNKGEPTYQDELAWSSANLAVLATIQKEQNLTQQFLNTAVSSSDQALLASPYNLNFHKTRAKIFFKLSQIDTKYLNEALAILQKAKQMAPTDAKIFYNLGLVQEALGQRQEAIKTLEETVEIKNNYIDARYMLGLLYKENGQEKEAISELEYIIKFLNAGYPLANDKLKQWKGQ